MITPKVVAAFPGATFLLVELPCHCEGMWETGTSRKEKLAILPPHMYVLPNIS
jgi:hypothetical protein